MTEFINLKGINPLGSIANFLAKEQKQPGLRWHSRAGIDKTSKYSNRPPTKL
jgi:hypothetical protein